MVNGTLRLVLWVLGGLAVLWLVFGLAMLPTMSRMMGGEAMSGGMMVGMGAMMGMMVTQFVAMLGLVGVFVYLVVDTLRRRRAAGG